MTSANTKKYKPPKAVVHARSTACVDFCLRIHHAPYKLKNLFQVLYMLFPHASFDLFAKECIDRGYNPEIVLTSTMKS